MVIFAVCQKKYPLNSMEAFKNMAINLKQDTDFQEFPVRIQNIRIEPKYFTDSFDENSQSIVETVIDIKQKDFNLFSLSLKHNKTEKIRIIEVQTSKHSDASKLEDILRDGNNVLCKLSNYSSDGSIGLLIAKFRGERYDLKEIDISFDETFI